MAGQNLRRTLVAAAAALAGVTVPLAGTAAADPGFRIVNGATGQCLDADTRTLWANGTKVQLWNCHGGSNQRWEYDHHSHSLRNAASGRCLDVDMDDGRIQLWDCHDGDNQAWWDDPGGLTLESVAQPDACLDVDRYSLGDNGATLHLQSCTGAPPQRWRFGHG